MWKAYRRRHLWFDGIVASVAASALTVGWVKEWIGGRSAAESVAVYATIAELAGIMLGFTLASVSILLSTLSADKFASLRKRADYGALYADYKLAIVSLGVTTIVALGATIAAAAGAHSPVILGLTLWLVGWSAAIVSHALAILWLVIQAHVSIEGG